jgi:hypothetical protein
VCKCNKLLYRQNFNLKIIHGGNVVHVNRKQLKPLYQLESTIVDACCHTLPNIELQKIYYMIFKLKYLYKIKMKIGKNDESLTKSFNNAQHKFEFFR